MINREKVIKGLDSCAKWMKENDCDACDNCPYHSSHFSYDNNDCIAAVNNDAITLLKEQEPIAPVYDQLLTQVIPRCGRCGYRLVKGKDKYCCMCGKEVKWND